MPPKTIERHSNAKINLALRITGQLPNGYHTISSLFQEIDLHDTLTFSPASNYSLTCSTPDLPCDERNLCNRAYRRMESLNRGGQAWQIFLKKRIPVGAGLGGGSSNAATVLKFLNDAWGLQQSDEKLERIAAEIGADVPFYIRGKTQSVEGIGDRLSPVSLPESFVLLLICPPVAISTRWAYQQFNLTNQKEGYKFQSLFNSSRINWELFENQFESVVFPTYPEIGAIKAELLAAGARYAGLSGSGSTVFGVFDDRGGAERAQKRFKSHLTHLSFPIIS